MMMQRFIGDSLSKMMGGNNNNVRKSNTPNKIIISDDDNKISDVSRSAININGE